MNDPFANGSDNPEILPQGSGAPYGRPSWSGLLQFSLVGIPLKAFPAVRSRDLPTAHLIHAGCGQRLRYAKQCPTHGPVDAAGTVRGYEYGPGQHVLVEPEELDQLRPAQDRALRLERFLTPTQFEPVLHAGLAHTIRPVTPSSVQRTRLPIRNVCPSVAVFFLLAMIVTPCRRRFSYAAPCRNDRTVTSRAARHEGQ